MAVVATVFVMGSLVSYILLFMVFGGGSAHSSSFLSLVAACFL